MTEPTSIRVIIVDDHAVVRSGLSTFLSAFDDLDLVGEAASGEDAVRLCTQTKPDVVLMDLVMPDMDGVAATSAIRKCCPDTQVIALTSFGDRKLVQAALKAGANGYLLKDISAEELVSAIRNAVTGRPSLSPDATKALIQVATEAPGIELDRPISPETTIKLSTAEDAHRTLEKTTVTVSDQIQQVKRHAAVSIFLGEDTTSAKPLFWEPEREQPRKLANPHVLIVGTSGSGKTQTTMAFVYEMWRQGIPSLILDFQGEYADPEASKFRGQTSGKVIDTPTGLPVNPLELPLDARGKPDNYKRVVWQVSEIIGNTFRLGLQQRRTLKKVIETAYQEAGFTGDSSTWNRRPPKFSQLKQILESQAGERGGVAAGLLSRIDVVFDVETFCDTAPNRFEDLIGKVTAVDLSRLFSDEHRLLVARFLLQKVYNHMLLQGESRDLRLFVVIDEAHRFSYDDALLRLIREARKYGVGILLSSQQPSDFPDTAIELPGTKVFLQQGPHGARSLATHLESADTKKRSQIEDELQKLEIGQAFIKNDHFSPYVKARIQLFYERLKK